MMYAALFIILLTIVPRSYCDQEKYYWQDYNGTVLEEAIEGGYDKNGNSIYIGQAKLNEDILVTAVYPNVSYVVVPHYSFAVKVESEIKILCGSQQPIDWVRAHSDDLQVVLIGKNPVRGGQVENESVHVGRIFYDNEIKIGSIYFHDLNHARLWAVHGDIALESTIYEVLLYDALRRHLPNRSRGRHRGRFH